MNHTNAETNINYIKEMIEKTKKVTASQWKFLYLWGVSILLGVTGMNILIMMRSYEYIWINWVVFMGIAVIVQIFLIKKEINGTEVRTYAQDSISYVSFSSGIAYALAGFVFPVLKVYSFGVIPIVISVITGTLLFTIGGIINWNYLKWSGILWFAASIIMIFVHWHYRSLVFIPLIIESYLIPAHILRKKYRENV